MVRERKKRWLKQAVDMSFLQRVAGDSLRDRGRSSVTWEWFKVELLLVRIKKE